MVSRDITEDVDLDESTIRRLRKNKYIDTPHGIFELEFYFDRNWYETTKGEKIASKGIKFLIGQIIQSENKNKPYSDQEIADMLENTLGVTAPPAERVASGSPLEGGDNVGKAPKGLL